VDEVWDETTVDLEWTFFLSRSLPREVKLPLDPPFLGLFAVRESLATASLMLLLGWGDLLLVRRDSD